MTPTALSRTRLQKSCTTSKPTSASSSEVRTSARAASTVASSSSARPWNFCFALRKPLVSVSNIAAESSIYLGNRLTVPRLATGLPPLLPARLGLLALALGQVEVVAEVLARDEAQLLRGREANLGRLVREAVEQPGDAVGALVRLP